MPIDRIELLARLLREDATEQELSGAELARRSGLPQTGIARLLRGDGDVTVSTLLGVLGALGRDLRWLHRQGVTPVSGESV